MYGTRKEIALRMKRAFTGSEKIAVLIWTCPDVTARAEDMTPQEADVILQTIGSAGLGDHTEEGVSQSTVLELLAGLRARERAVTLSADLLERVTQAAEHALLAREGAAWDAGWEGPAAISEGLADIARVRALLAA